VVSTGVFAFGKAVGLYRWVVFGTLLGPEATGPGVFPGFVFLVFLAASKRVFVRVGCVVWGCCLRTT
jgi:hypothetical protein